jgi:hypothetical protein
MGFDLGDLTNIPTDEELIAQTLGKIEGELKHVDDPNVWSRDDESPGLLMLLEDCIASEYYGIALSIAFDLGIAAVLDKVDPSALAKHRAGVKARRQGTQRSTITRQASATEWRAVLPQLLEKHRAVGRGHQDWKSRIDLAAIAALEIKKKLGLEIAESTIADAIEEIERETR